MNDVTSVGIVDIPLKAPCPPTLIALIEHYARSLCVCEHPHNKNIFLQDLLAVCQLMHRSGIGTDVLTDQQAQDLGLQARRVTGVSTQQTEETVVRQHMWKACVSNVCDEAHPRELNFVSTYDFDTAVTAAKKLIAKKWPNKFESWPDAPWHPDYELVGIRRGMELDSAEEEPT